MCRNNLVYKYYVYIIYIMYIMNISLIFYFMDLFSYTYVKSRMF